MVFIIKFTILLGETKMSGDNETLSISSDNNNLVASIKSVWMQCVILKTCFSVCWIFLTWIHCCKKYIYIYIWSKSEANVFVTEELYFVMNYI